MGRLTKGAASPELQEIERRADEFERDIARRRRATLLVWIAAILALGGALTVLSGCAKNPVREYFRNVDGSCTLILRQGGFEIERVIDGVVCPDGVYP